MRLSQLFLSILLLTLAALPAQALPPPLSAKELDEQSDFVGTVRVLGVTCIGTLEAPGNKEQVLAWQAWLQVTAVKKGSVKANETLLVQWQDTPKMLIGPWKVDYFPGEEAATHLRWDNKNRVYNTTWWNAKSEPSKPATNKKLPEKAGEVMMAAGGAGAK